MNSTNVISHGPQITISNMIVACTSGTLIVLFACLFNGIVVQTLAFAHKRKGEKNTNQIVTRAPRTPLASVNSVTGVFLLNLAIIDILSAIINIPINIIHDIIVGKWLFGITACYIVMYTQSLITYVYALTQIVISLDRFSAVYWPINRRKIISLRHARIVVFVLWLICALINIAIILVVKPAIDLNQRCRQNFRFIADYFQTDETEVERLYSIVDLHMHYIIPLLFLTGTYLAIVKRLWGSTAPGTLNIWREAYQKKTKKKIVKMVIVVAVLFAVMRIPRHIYFYFINESYSSINLYLFVFTFDWLAYTVNPIIYAWMNASFRSSFLTSLNCVFCKNIFKPIKNGEEFSKRSSTSRKTDRAYDVSDTNSIGTIC